MCVIAFFLKICILAFVCPAVITSSGYRLSLHHSSQRTIHRPSLHPARTGAAGNTDPVGACGRATPGGGAAGWSAACPAAG